ncbi:hypothetical protein GCM10017744_079160 [Streptomyces antimycoticus]|uniref:Uncharacterized protein n=1 Tax=Streptomyces antimycoticus TaxID=68175 RepID=A0A4D4JWZ9_9ACTN|nr:hypothetical protein SANT12839_022230 [Streptomyces antimycoticus]
MNKVLDKPTDKTAVSRVVETSGIQRDAVCRGSDGVRGMANEGVHRPLGRQVLHHLLGLTVARLSWFTASPGIELVVDGVIKRGDRVVGFGCVARCRPGTN